MTSKRAITPRDLLTLWTAYAAFRQGQIAPSTAKRDYGKIRKRIERMVNEADHLTNAIELRNWLMCEYSADTARRTLVQFNACCRWAKESEMLDINPLEGLQRHIRKAPPGQRSCTPFTESERDAIIQAFREAESPYLQWVRFLFWTGCRPEEARALHWERHVSGEISEILFEEAWPIDMDKPQAIKNYKSTRFPLNARLQMLLRGIQPRDRNRDRYVFTGPRGETFDYANFQTRHWKPTVEKLVKKGAIAFYLPQYHCRHTWITMALRAGMEIADVAYLARVSPGVIWSNYAGRSQKITVPEF